MRANIIESFMQNTSSIFC